MGGFAPRAAICRALRSERSGSGQIGQSLVELGLMLPVLLVLIIGVVEVSASFNDYVTVVSAARDGARLGSKGSASDTEVQALVVKDLSRLRNPSATSDVTVTHPTVNSLDAIDVQACHDHKTLLQVPLILPKTFRLCSDTIMPVLN